MKETKSVCFGMCITYSLIVCDDSFYLYLGRIIGMDTGCAGYRWVLQREEHTRTVGCASLPGGEEGSPRGRDGGRMLPSEEEGDKQTHDLVVRVDGVVLVLHVHENLHGPCDFSRL